MKIVLPSLFLKSIADKGNLYSRLWVYWLGDFVEEILNPDFIEIQVKNLSKHVKETEIREIYHYGVQFLQQDFHVEKEIDQEEVIKMATEAIEYLNSKTGLNFMKKGNNIELAKARIKEGFTISDIKVVIDKKVLEWKGTEQEKYLRPLTLFSKSKFENYLNSYNEKPRTKFGKFAAAANRAKEFVRFREE